MIHFEVDGPLDNNYHFTIVHTCDVHELTASFDVAEFHMYQHLHPLEEKYSHHCFIGNIKVWSDVYTIKLLGWLNWLHGSVIPEHTSLSQGVTGRLLYISLAVRDTFADICRHVTAR
jgi:hypothetical protein